MTFQLPISSTPLNQHSLTSLEIWLNELGAEQAAEDPSLWKLKTVEWSATIKMERAELIVTWLKDGEPTKCAFPYGLPRKDVQVGIEEGP